MSEIKKELIILEDHKDLSIKKRIEALSTGEKFNIFQEMLQEIQATDIVESVDHETSIPLTKQLDKLREYINQQFKDDDAVRNLLLEYFPPYKTIYSWTSKAEWKNEVVNKVKGSFNFSEKRRTKVFDAIYQKAVQKGDMKAAELFCKLSGDLSSATVAKDSKEKDDMNIFNKILHGKK